MSDEQHNPPQADATAPADPGGDPAADAADEDFLAPTDADAPES